MREIKLSTIDLQVFNHLQKCFSNKTKSIDIKNGVVNFIKSTKDIAVKYETQSGFKDFEFPNVNKHFAEMRSLCGVNSKIFIDDKVHLKIKSKRKEFNFREGHSINLRHPNIHDIPQTFFEKEAKDICFNMSSLDFEDIRKRYQKFDKIFDIQYFHLFTNIASEIVIAFEVYKERHTYFHNTFIKSNKDFYLILKTTEVDLFKYLLRDNYEVRVKTFGEDLDACITFHNLSIPLITTFTCQQKEKNYCPLGDFNEVVTGFEYVQDEPVIENAPEPDSTELEGLERFTK